MAIRTDREELIEIEPEWHWQFAGVGMLRNPLPRGVHSFYEWRWDDFRNRRWLVFGQLVIRIPFLRW